MKKSSARRFIAQITAAFIFITALIIVMIGLIKINGYDEKSPDYAFANTENAYPQDAKDLQFYIENDGVMNGYKLLEGNYYLSEDFTLDSKFAVIGVVNIYFNNHVIYESGNNYLRVQRGTLNLYGDGGIVNSSSGVAYGVKLDNATSQINLYGGTISATGSGAGAYGIYMSDGTAGIFNGEIFAESKADGFEAYGIYASESCYVSVEGGKVSGTNGAVKMQSMAGINISGGEIAGAVGITAVGSEIYVLGGSFNCETADLKANDNCRIYASQSGIGYTGDKLYIDGDFTPTEGDVIVNAVLAESKDKFILKWAEAPFTLLYDEVNNTLSYGHEHVLEYTEKFPPTCETEGERVGSCTVPSCTYKTSEKIPTIPHSVNRLVVSGQPAKKEYIALESFDCTGLTFSAICDECGQSFSVENCDISYICGGQLQFGDEFVTIGADYNGTRLTCEYPVSVRKIEVERVAADSTEFIYNGSVQTYAPTGFDDKVMSIGGNNFKDANTDGYDVTVTLKDDKNYCWKDGGTGEIVLPFVIAQKSVTIDNFTVDDKIYGGEYGGVNAENVKIIGLVGGDDVQLNTAYYCGGTALSSAPKNVGEYTVEISLSGGNYKIEGNTQFAYKIDKAPLTVSAANCAVFYGDEPANGGVVCSGFVLGEDESALTGELKYTYDYDRFNSVGKYKITPYGLKSDNYEISFEEGVLTVSALPVSVTVNAASSVYGSNLSKLSATVSGGKIFSVDKDVFSLSTAATSSSDAGNYDIFGTVLNKNYDVTFIGGAGAYTVNKATLDLSGITFDDAAVAFDGQLHYIEIEGKLPDGVSVNYVGNGKAECGEHTVTAYFSVDETNYNKIKPMTAVLTVGAAISPDEPQIDTDTNDQQTGENLNGNQPGSDNDEPQIDTDTNDQQIGSDSNENQTEIDNDKPQNNDSQSNASQPSVGTKSDVTDSDAIPGGDYKKANIAIIISIVCASAFGAAAIVILGIKIVRKKFRNK